VLFGVLGPVLVFLIKTSGIEATQDLLHTVPLACGTFSLENCSSSREVVVSTIDWLSPWITEVYKEFWESESLHLVTREEYCFLLGLDHGVK